MPTLSFELRPRSSRCAPALRPLPTPHLRSEVAAATSSTSATSAPADVGASGLGEDGAPSADIGIWALLLAAAATEALVNINGGGPLAVVSPQEKVKRGRPFKKSGKRRNNGHDLRKEKKHRSVAPAAGGPNRRLKLINLKLAYLRLKLELAALLWIVFISHAYLRACATGKDKSEINEKLYVDPKQTVRTQQKTLVIGWE